MAKVKVIYLLNLLDNNVKPISSDIEGDTLIECMFKFTKINKLQHELYNTELLVHVNNFLIHVDDWKKTQVYDNDIIEIKPVVGVTVSAALGVSLFAGYAIGIVGGMALMGAAMYATNRYIKRLIPDLEVPDYDYDKDTGNYSWTGAVTKAQEGIPIPIIYGEHCTGGNVLSENLYYINGETALNVLLGLGEATLNAADTATANFCVNEKSCTEIDNFTNLFSSIFFPNGISTSYFDGSNAIPIVDITEVSQLGMTLDQNEGWTAFFDPRIAFEQYCQELSEDYWDGPSDWSYFYSSGSAIHWGQNFYPDNTEYLTYNWGTDVIHSVLTRSNINLNFTISGCKAIILLRYSYVYTNDDGSHLQGERYAGTDSSSWGEYGSTYRYWTSAYAIWHRWPWAYYAGKEDEWPWGDYNDDWDHSSVRFAEFTSDRSLQQIGYNGTGGGWSDPWGEPYREYPGLYVMEGMSGWSKDTPFKSGSKRLYEDAQRNISMAFACPSDLPEDASVKIEVIRIDDWPFSLSLENSSEAAQNTSGYNQLSMVYLMFSSATEFLSGSVPTFKIPVQGINHIRTWYLNNGSLVYSGKSYSKNPVWCLIDLLTHRRYGFGEYLSIDNIDLTTAAITAKKCELLGYELNIILDSSVSLEDALEAILEVFHGFITIGFDGKIKILMDYKELAPIQCFSRSDIVAGSLVSSFTSLKNNPNALELRFTDYLDKYKLRVLYLDTNNLYQDSDAWQAWSGSSTIDQVRMQTVNIRGTTNFEHTVRLGYYKLAKCIRGSQVVSFKARPSAIACQPGELISLQDILVNSELGGRLMDLEVNGNTGQLILYLDQPITIDSSHTWKIYSTLIGDTSGLGTNDSSSGNVSYFALELHDLPLTNSTTITIGLADIEGAGLNGPAFYSAIAPTEDADIFKLKPNYNINYIIGYDTTSSSIGNFIYDEYGYPTYYYDDEVNIIHGTCLRITEMKYEPDENCYEITGLVYDPSIYPNPMLVAS